MKSFPYPIPIEVTDKLQEWGIVPEALTENLAPSPAKGLLYAIALLDNVALELCTFKGSLGEIGKLLDQPGAQNPLSTWEGQLDNLLTALCTWGRWARVTWEYDPEILKLVNGNGNGKKNSDLEKSGSEVPEGTIQRISVRSCAREEHPYTLPSTTSSRASSAWFQLLLRYAEGWTPADYLPLALTCFESWANRISEQVAILDAVCDERNSQIIWGVKHSLERLLDDFNELLKHSRLTLPYDPWLAVNTSDSAE